jgi:hypothetical protein
MMTKPVIAASKLLGFRLLDADRTVTADDNAGVVIAAKFGAKLGLKDGGKTVLGSIGTDVFVAPRR